MVVANHEAHIIWSNVSGLVVLAAMPLVLIPFEKPTFRYALVSQGYQAANGAEQAVPGMAVLFAFFLVNSAGYSVFQEHFWGTWDRLRVSELSIVEIICGKLVPWMLVAFVQISVLFVLGRILFGLQIKGALAAITLVTVSLALVMATLGIALASACRTIRQFATGANLCAMVLGGLGGTLTPIAALPFWARVAAPFTPSYWAMKAFEAIILDGADSTKVLSEIVVLCTFAVGFGLYAVVRLRFSEAKVIA
jgi:ABC-2 type transport system permease protein